MKNVTDLMKNNLLTQVKRVHYSIKSMYDSSRNQMVELQDQPTTWSQGETFPLLICQAKWVISAAYSSLNFHIVSAITEHGDGGHIAI